MNYIQFFFCHVIRKDEDWLPSQLVQMNQNYNTRFLSITTPVTYAAILQNVHQLVPASAIWTLMSPAPIQEIKPLNQICNSLQAKESIPEFLQKRDQMKEQIMRMDRNGRQTSRELTSFVLGGLTCKGVHTRVMDTTGVRNEK